MAFKDALFAAPVGREIQSVSTPVGHCFVRTLTCKEKDDFDLAVKKDGHLRARLLIACCCDSDGNPEFDEFDLVRLSELPVRHVEPAVDAAIRLNRMSEDDAEASRKN